VTSPFEVELCYRFILGREPESADVVNELAQTYPTVPELRRAMLASDEFKTQIGSSNAVALGELLWPPNAVDVDVPPEYLKKMMRRVEQSWENLGDTEPFWSVLTHDRFLAANLEANKAAFYESGKTGTEFFFAAAARAGITDFSGLPVCMEYGCGVGRLTVWLAERFKKVIACDISQPHLDLAKVTFEQRHIYNIESVRVASVDAVAELPSFDVFFSLIVLQHNPPPIAAYILRQVLQKLNPGGLAYFQIPTYRVSYKFDARQYVESEDRLEMEMHAIPQKDLFALFVECGCSVLEVREDSWVGDASFVSNTFLLQKYAS
jgi:2-polyprenyl-3-methyl-5-hydroxy-6-metoxy-1,4-benzoquinol methylase